MSRVEGPPGGDWEKVLLARHFGAKDTRAWRAFLSRHRTLALRLTRPPDESVGALEPSPGPSPPRIAEESRLEPGKWLLVWPERGRWIFARPLGRQAQLLGSLETGYYAQYPLLKPVTIL